MFLLERAFKASGPKRSPAVFLLKPACINSPSPTWRLRPPAPLSICCNRLSQSSPLGPLSIAGVMPSRAAMRDSFVPTPRALLAKVSILGCSISKNSRSLPKCRAATRNCWTRSTVTPNRSEASFICSAKSSMDLTSTLTEPIPIAPIMAPLRPEAISLLSPLTLLPK